MDCTHHIPPARSQLGLPDELIAEILSAILSRSTVLKLSRTSFHLRRHALAHNLHWIACRLDLEEAADLLYLEESTFGLWSQRVMSCASNRIKMRIAITMGCSPATLDSSAEILQVAAEAVRILSHADPIWELDVSSNSSVWEHTLHQLVLRPMPQLRLLTIEINGSPAVLVYGTFGGVAGRLDRVSLGNVRCVDDDALPAFAKVRHAELFSNDLSCLSTLQHLPSLTALELSTLTADLSRAMDEERLKEPEKLLSIFGRCESVTFCHHDSSVDWSRNVAQLQYLWKQATCSESVVFLTLEFLWYGKDIGPLVAAATETLCATGDGFEHVALAGNRRGIAMHADVEDEGSWLLVEIIHPSVHVGHDADWRSWTEERKSRLLHLIPAFNRAIEIEIPFHLLGAASDIIWAALAAGNIETFTVDVTEDLPDDFRLWSNEPRPSAFIETVMVTMEWDVPSTRSHDPSRRTGLLIHNSTAQGPQSEVDLVIYSSRSCVKTTVEYIAYVAMNAQLVGPNSREGSKSIRLILDNVELTDCVAESPSSA